MKVHVLQHVPFEGIGSMERWLAKRDATMGYTRFYESAKLPDPGRVDLVIAMGGPMSVDDEQAHPWLAPEKEFIRETIRLGQSVVGICLGAQLIASALGSRVYPGRHTEIGWFPVEAVAADGDVFQLPGGLTAFHWHGETFDLPELTREVEVDHAWRFGGQSAGAEDALTVRIRVDARHVTWIERFLGGDAEIERADDGTAIVSEQVRDLAAFRSFVLTFLDGAEIIGPAEARADIVAWLEAMAGVVDDSDQGGSACRA